MRLNKTKAIVIQTIITMGQPITVVVEAPADEVGKYTRFVSRKTARLVEHIKTFIDKIENEDLSVLAIYTDLDLVPPDIPQDKPEIDDAFPGYVVVDNRIDVD